MTDPIADMLTRIRNAAAVRKPTVVIPFSKLKNKLALILKKEHYIENLATIQVAGRPNLELTLRYLPDGQSAIQAVNRISKPGRRVYAQKKVLPYVQNNFGLAIISTSQGLMTNKQARQKNLGGEVICEIY
ncbi:MAG: 30S ribosomal protein S8 [Patescibacteria group bacterium]|jgi:small subunit ribosomal protein S8